jgi:hypothetical protein
MPALSRKQLAALRQFDTEMKQAERRLLRRMNEIEVEERRRYKMIPGKWKIENGKWIYQRKKNGKQ